MCTKLQAGDRVTIYRERVPYGGTVATVVGHFWRDIYTIETSDGRRLQMHRENLKPA